MLKYVRQHRLLNAGDRVAVAVSGGADSVALLRLLLELQDELGIVLQVAHFHHGIRQGEADADRDFVSALAAKYDLEFHCDHADVPAHARLHRMTIEEGARALRFSFFRELAERHRLQRIATGHTADDQAETVLMKFIRGSATRGLAGIFPQQPLGNASLIRPFLSVQRKQVEEYLQSLGQAWCEDSTNLDLHHTRNRIRQRLLPLLEQELNPAVVEVLGHTAEIARAEEEYWQGETRRLLPLVLLPGKPVRGGGRASGAGHEAIAGVSLEGLMRYPLATQRRLLRAAAESLNIHLDFEHVLAIESLLCKDTNSEGTGKEVELPRNFIVRRGLRELRFEPQRPHPHAQFVYELSIPGAQHVPELGTTLLTRLIDEDVPRRGYNQRCSIELPQATGKLVIRAWKPGDRFWPAHTGAEKKLKELLQPLHIPPEQRALWPVVASGEQILWVRGLKSPPILVTGAQGPKLLVIEERLTDLEASSESQIV